MCSLDAEERRSSATAAASRVTLTVAICTRNRRESLLQAIRSIASQRSAVAWELLVVDNGSTDGSADSLRELSKSFPVDLRLEHEGRAGLAFARNRAIECSRGENLIFIDDDVTCLPGWLDAYAKGFENESVSGIAGRILPRMPPGTPRWFLEILPSEIGGPTSRFDFGDEPIEIRSGSSLPPPFGANMGVRRALAVAAGGVRTDLGWGEEKMIPGEETEFFHRILERGGRLVYQPEAVLEHRIEKHRVTWEYYVDWHRGFGRASVRMRSDRTAAGRLRLGLKECNRFVGSSVKVLVNPAYSPRAIKGSRRRAKAQGRIAELLGL